MARILIFLYAIATLFIIFMIVLVSNGYSFYGYWADKLVKWIWLLFTIFISIWFWKKRIIKIYISVLFSLLVLSIIPMAIPFIGIVYSFTTISDYQQIDLNENYRLERTRYSALSMQRIFIYKREGLLEKNIYRTAYSDILENILKVNEDFEMGNKLSIQNAKLISVSNDSIGIEYTILDKTTVYYHKYDNDGY